MDPVLELHTCKRQISLLARFSIAASTTRTRPGLDTLGLPMEHDEMGPQRALLVENVLRAWSDASIDLAAVALRLERAGADVEAAP